MNVVWGIRWDREDDRRRRLLVAVALLAALAAVALLLISRGARAWSPCRRSSCAPSPTSSPPRSAPWSTTAARSGSRCRSSTDSSHRCRPAPSAPSARRTAWPRVVADGPMKGWADAGKAAAATAATPGTTLAEVREAIGADQSGATGSGVDVAVIDTGMVPVPALAAQGKVVQGPDFSDQSRDRDLAHLDTFGHGTHVAGIIAGDDPKSGFQGVAPGARLVNVKAAGADGSTTPGRDRRLGRLGHRAPQRQRAARPRPQPLLRHAAQPLPERPARLRGRAGVEGGDRRGRLGRQRGREAPRPDLARLRPVHPLDRRRRPLRHGRRGRRRRALVVEPRAGPQPRPRRAGPLDRQPARPELRPRPRAPRGARGRRPAQGQRHVAGRRRRLGRRRAAARAPARPLARPGQGDRQVLRRPAVRTRARRPGCGPAQRHPRARRGEPRPRVGGASRSQPAAIRGVVAKLVAGLSKGRHAEVGPVGPDGSSWGGAKWGGAKWGGASWGGSSWGGSSWGGSSWGGSSWGGSSWGGSSWGGSSWGGSSWGDG